MLLTNKKEYQIHIGTKVSSEHSISMSRRSLGHAYQSIIWLDRTKFINVSFRKGRAGYSHLNVSV